MIAPLPALPLLLAALAACEEPGTLAALTDAYAAGYLPIGGPAIRYGLALSSMTAEICAVEDPADHAYTGYGARALSPATFTPQAGADGGLIITFTEAGLDGDPGVLQIATDEARTQWRHTLVTSNDQTFEATTNTPDCSDPSRLQLITAGTWVGPTEFTMAEGGMVFDADAYPVVGQPRWVDSTDKIDLTLAPAEDIPEDTPWPGLMVGPGWESRIAVDW